MACVPTVYWARPHDCQGKPSLSGSASIAAAAARKRAASETFHARQVDRQHLPRNRGRVWALVVQTPTDRLGGGGARPVGKRSIADTGVVSPTIRVDDEVYVSLQQEAQAFVDTPNTVLRRLLQLDDSASRPASGGVAQSTSTGATSAAKFARLYTAGLMSPGDELVWERRNNGQRYVVVVDERGHFHLTDGSVHDSPSGAAKHLAGYEVGGWRVWRLPDGRSLDDLIVEEAWTRSDPDSPGLFAPRPPRGISRSDVRHCLLHVLHHHPEGIPRQRALAEMQQILTPRLAMPQASDAVSESWMDLADTEYRFLNSHGRATDPESNYWQLVHDQVDGNRPRDGRAPRSGSRP